MHTLQIISSGGVHLTQIFPQKIVKLVFVGEPRMFSYAWGVIKTIIPQSLRDTVTFLGQDLEALTEIVGGRECSGSVEATLQNLARDRMKRGKNGVERGDKYLRAETPEL
jgi:hypothetical protein